MAGTGFRSLDLGPAAFIAALGVERAAQAGLGEAAAKLETKWKQVLSRPGSGRIYTETFVTTRRSPRRVIPIGPRSSVGLGSPHRASRPGEPPAPDTGTGRASVGTRRIDARRIRVGTGSVALRSLEFGVFNHPGGITIEPRPHARVALEEAEAEMSDTVSARLKAGLRVARLGRGGR